ncbi:hypothetical protein B5M09_012907 [Aphanomyces astaci]|uniref:Uncharacterized protein n=1 Tax=Aphanomyces astaci TaxID=112090 RepID=A0A425DGV5_APHAT|nr:hypothetical protein B5M09_012907 [Aphanomyces astaci]
MMLREDNWNFWRTALKGRMLSKKFKAVYDGGVALANERGLAASNAGNITTPARTSTQDTTYSDDNDVYALGILLTCCSESQQQYVAEGDTYGDAWCALTKHHEQKTRVDRLATLSEYFNMKWNTKQESLPQFLERYEIVLRKLKASGDAIHEFTPCRRRRGNSGKKDQNKEDSGNLALDEVVWIFAAIEDEEVEDADSNAFVFYATDSRGRVLVDSGASTHMTGDATRLTDLKPCDRMVIVANGGRTRATKVPCG